MTRESAINILIKKGWNQYCAEVIIDTLPLGTLEHLTVRELNRIMSRYDY